MFNIRTDLALEAHEIASKNKKHIVDGVIFCEEYKASYKLTRVEIISRDGEKATGKPMGKYLTLDVGRIWNQGCDELESVCLTIGEMIKELSGSVSSALVVGLGNVDITADALGPKAVSQVIVTRHLKTAEPEIFKSMSFGNIAAFAPGVMSQTGIETAEAIKSITDKITPDVVVVIDALATGDLSRLGTVVQISNTGISPGSGVGNRRSTINRETLGVPVIAIGIPTVMDAVALIYDKENQKECEDMFITPKDCDKIISFMSRVIGYSIDMAFHDKLSLEDIISVLN